jgi:hypothetical protein
MTASTHHVGATYISTGYDAASSKGHTTIYICVPNADNDGGTSYGVYHTGNAPIITSSKTVSMPANTSNLSVTAPTVSGYTFVCWLQPASNGHVTPACMSVPNSATTNLWQYGGTVTNARNFIVTALYRLG